MGRRKRAELLDQLGPAFARTGPWLQAGKYVAAVMSDLPRRNGWTIARHAGDRSPDRTQRLLNRAAWDTMAAMSAVRQFAVAGLDQAAARRRGRRPLAIGALDETGQEKAGTATAGVQRQHMGCAGGVENGINTVHLFLCPRGYRARADRRPPVDPARADQRPGPVAADGPAAGPSVRDQRRAGQGDRRRRAR